MKTNSKCTNPTIFTSKKLIVSLFYQFGSFVGPLLDKFIIVWQMRVQSGYTQSPY